MVFRQKLRINVPPPEPGFGTAKLIVTNYCGQSIEIDYTYEDLCDVPVMPPIVLEPSFTYIDAYTECLDEIQDLFCTPVTPVQEPGAPVTSVEISSFSAIDPPPYTAAQTVTLQFKINVTNYPTTDLNYRISSIPNVFADQYYEGVISREADNQTVEITIPANLITGDDVKFTLAVPFDGVSSQLTLRIENPAPPPEPRVLPFDNDVSNAKKELYVLANNIPALESTLEDYRIATNTENLLTDPFRSKYGGFWIKESDEEDKIVFAKGQSSVLFDKVSGINITSQYFEATPHNYYMENLDDISEISNFNYTYDISYVHQKMYTEKEAAQVELPYNSLILDVKQEYNYYNKKYEEIHAELEESFLPNIYYISLNDQMIDGKKTPEIEDDIVIDPDIKKLLTLNNDEADGAEPLRTESYYNYFTDRYPLRNIDDQQLMERSKEIVIPFSFLDKVEEYGNDNQSYPMFVDLRFDTEVAGLLTFNLRDKKYFGQQFINKAISLFKTTNRSFNFIKQEYEDNPSGLFRSENRYIEVNDLMNGISENSDDTYVYLGNYAEFNNFENNDLIFQQEKEQFDAILKRLYKTYSRTYKDIIDGKKCYKETLFYKIVKFAVGDETPLQSIYVPKDTARNYFRYIDTQVKYDKQYTYRIYSYDFVLGNLYRFYKALSLVQFTNQIRPYIIENIYDEFQIAVSDKPPIFPQVNILPYKDVDNKLLLLFNNSNGDAELEEIIIKEEDRASFEKARMKQMLEENELITFSGDDIPKKYQIFKTTTAPFSYEDFSTAEMIEVSTLIDENSTARATPASFIDNIRPNTKYYFTFRTVDIHDQISNPTEIYEVEMINENGTIFPIIQTWKFPKVTEKQIAKTAKRFIMLKPTVLQSYMNVDTTGVDTIENLRNQVVDAIGVKDVSVWGDKKFKMRIVSKHTGKIYDINIKFNKKGEIVE